MVTTIKKIQLEKNVVMLRDMETKLNSNIKELQALLQEPELEGKLAIEQQFDLLLELKRSVLRTVYLMTEK